MNNNTQTTKSGRVIKPKRYSSEFIVGGDNNKNKNNTSTNNDNNGKEKRATHSPASKRSTKTRKINHNTSKFTSSNSSSSSSTSSNKTEDNNNDTNKINSAASTASSSSSSSTSNENIPTTPQLPAPPSNVTTDTPALSTSISSTQSDSSNDQDIFHTPLSSLPVSSSQIPASSSSSQIFKTPLPKEPPANNTNLNTSSEKDNLQIISTKSNSQSTTSDITSEKLQESAEAIKSTFNATSIDSSKLASSAMQPSFFSCYFNSTPTFINNYISEVSSPSPSVFSSTSPIVPSTSSTSSTSATYSTSLISSSSSSLFSSSSSSSSSSFSSVSSSSSSSSTSTSSTSCASSTSSFSSCSSSSSSSSPSTFSTISTSTPSVSTGSIISGPTISYFSSSATTSNLVTSTYPAVSNPMYNIISTNVTSTTLSTIPQNDQLPSSPISEPAPSVINYIDDDIDVDNMAYCDTAFNENTSNSNFNNYGANNSYNESNVNTSNEVEIEQIYDDELVNHPMYDNESQYNNPNQQNNDNNNFPSNDYNMQMQDANNYENYNNSQLVAVEHNSDSCNCDNCMNTNYKLDEYNYAPQPNSEHYNINSNNNNASQFQNYTNNDDCSQQQCDYQAFNLGAINCRHVTQREKIDCHELIAQMAMRIKQLEDELSFHRSRATNTTTSSSVNNNNNDSYNNNNNNDIYNSNNTPVLQPSSPPSRASVLNSHSPQQNNNNNNNNNNSFSRVSNSPPSYSFPPPSINNNNTNINNNNNNNNNNNPPNSPAPSPSYPFPPSQFFTNSTPSSQRYPHPPSYPSSVSSSPLYPLPPSHSNSPSSFLPSSSLPSSSLSSVSSSPLYPAPPSIPSSHSLLFSSPPPLSSSFSSSSSSSISSNHTLEEQEQNLSDEQRKVLELALAGGNIFLTGGAGTGKSYLLRIIIKKLEQAQKKVAVTASTGIAALPLNGVTLHSFTGSGVPSTYSDFKKMWKYKDRWRDLNVLIIEEISMVGGEYFDALEESVAEIREDKKEKKDRKPWGGVQIIVCGDFHQLPPVFHTERLPIGERVKRETTEGSREFKITRFAFESKAWRKCKMRHVRLTQVFRQQDLFFSSILKDISEGVVTEEAIETLNACRRPVGALHGIQPTLLFCKNYDVDHLNQARANELPGDFISFLSKDDRIPSEKLRSEEVGDAIIELEGNKFWEDCLAVRELKLKENAQVMLLKNLYEKENLILQNGSRGVISRWVPVNEVIDSIHFKLKNCDINDPAQAMEKQKLVGMKKIIQKFNTEKFPLVRFMDIERLILPEKFSSKVPGIGECLRIQIPLKFAWAITVHKSQGMTLDLATIKIDNAFTTGQVYTALSRVRSLEGLEIQGEINREKITINRRVQYFDSDFLNIPINESANVKEDEEMHMYRRSNDSCYHCHQKGHWQTDCQLKKRNVF